MFRHSWFLISACKIHHALHNARYICIFFSNRYHENYTQLTHTFFHLKGSLHGEFQPGRQFSLVRGLRFHPNFWSKPSWNEISGYMEKVSVQAEIHPKLKIPGWKFRTLNKRYSFWKRKTSLKSHPRRLWNVQASFFFQIWQLSRCFWTALYIFKLLLS